MGQVKRALMKQPVRTLPGNKRVPLNVGDVLLTTRGKTFFVTGWNEIEQTIQGQTTCEQHYFISAPASTLNCSVVEG